MRLRYTVRTGAVGSSADGVRAVGSRSKAASSRSRVASVDPSFTTSTSTRGYCRLRKARVDSTQVTASLEAGAIRVIGGRASEVRVSSGR